MKDYRTIGRWLLLSALSAVMVASFTAISSAQIAVGISVRVGPPALPVYAQPLCPGPGYLWTPGYWAWNDDAGYYWVPGTWVVAPVGLLWTPGYWGWSEGLYVWHGGYWGPHVGFYGGINYGFGYGGAGFAGGEWRGGGFYYNRSVTNVSVTNVTNVYNKTVIVNHTTTVSYNGGTGGVAARPTPQEESYARESHTEPLTSQVHQRQLASQNRQNFASENHGRPAVAATARAGDFSSHSVVAARAAGGAYHAPAMSPREARGPAASSENRGAKPKEESRNAAPKRENSEARPKPNASAPREHNAEPNQASKQSRPAARQPERPAARQPERPAARQPERPAARQPERPAARQPERPAPKPQRASPPPRRPNEPKGKRR